MQRSIHTNVAMSINDQIAFNAKVSLGNVHGKKRAGANAFYKEFKLMAPPDMSKAFRDQEKFPIIERGGERYNNVDEQHKAFDKQREEAREETEESLYKPLGA